MPLLPVSRRPADRPGALKVRSAGVLDAKTMATTVRIGIHQLDTVRQFTYRDPTVSQGPYCRFRGRFSGLVVVGIGRLG
jgi:hypothetical protein